MSAAWAFAAIPWVAFFAVLWMGYQFKRDAAESRALLQKEIDAWERDIPATRASHDRWMENTLATALLYTPSRTPESAPEQPSVG